jgi:periplasmic divalent cation tolerance protein
MTDTRIVLSTAGSEQEAHKIAQHLVTNRLAACVNIIPHVESIYRWQDRVESNREWLLLIKTTAECAPAVRDAIEELHSYELPECIVLSIEDGSSAYIEWLQSAVRSEPDL